MSLKNDTSFAAAFLESSKVNTFIAAIASGLYPILFYYSNNFPLVNSWGHLVYFLGMFIVLPGIVFFLVQKLFKAIPFLQKWQTYVLPFLGIFTFLFLMKVCFYAGIQKKISLLIIVLAALFAFFLWKHFKKVILVQLILAVIGFVTLIPVLQRQLFFDTSWIQQPDAIEAATFVKSPNVYFIQPDGYVNVSEIDKGYYQFDNSVFEKYLETNNFKTYENFRSNYASTLTSNSATFMMKHHYYNGQSSYSEGVKMRDIIVSDNTVLSIFKNNGYKTVFLAENNYLMLNKPTIGFDESNINSSEIPFIGTGLGESKDIEEALDLFAFKNETPTFFFIEFLLPSHIAGRKLVSKGAKEERAIWKDNLEKSNSKLKGLISRINLKDPNALIVIMADHGGFVGFDYAEQSYIKTVDRDLVYSIFSSNLSIRWPENKPPMFDSKFSSSVNLFRILFSYLSNNESYLKHLEEDNSYIILNDGAPSGVYKYISDSGEVTVDPLK